MADGSGSLMSGAWRGGPYEGLLWWGGLTIELARVFDRDLDELRYTHLEVVVNTSENICANEGAGDSRDDCEERIRGREARMRVCGRSEGAA